jgi:DNA-binding protein H-NS
MYEDLDKLLEEIESLLNALTNPDRKVSGKSEKESIARYENFKKFRHAIIKLLIELDETTNDENED